MSSEDHSPHTGCNYNTCGIPEDAHNCPFTRDDKPLPSFTAKHECKHEWRQRFVYDAMRGYLREDGYYCIHCREIEKS